MNFPRVLLVLTLASFTAIGADLRVGLIGLDTSHVVAFTELLNTSTHAKHVKGARVVAAFKGGSPDLPSSWNRVEGYTKDLESRFQVRMVESIDALCSQVDAVFLMSVDGRPHLEQLRPVLKARKPVFIDKPLAGSLKDAVEIHRLVKESGVPCFSSSSYRFYESMRDLKAIEIGKLQAAISYGPAEKEPHHPDLYWYGVHATEALFTVMGQGCQSVSRTATDATDVVVGVWKEGRTGTLMGLRTGATPHKVILFGSKAVAEQKGSGDYAPLVQEIVKFLQTGKAPVSMDETLEMFAFMEAADESKRQAGAPVTLKSVLEKATPAR